MKLHHSNPRYERDFWAYQHRFVAADLRVARRSSGDRTTPRAGRAARRYDLAQLKQMRGKRRAMGVR